MPDPAPVLSLVEVSVLPDVDAVSLTLDVSRSVVLLGEGSSGKSTVVRVAAGLLQPDRGEVRRRGHASPGVMFRNAAASFEPDWQVADVVLEPVGRWPWSRRTRAAGPPLAAVGLRPEDGRRRAGTLTPGEGQLVALARAMARSPDLIIADDVTALLDPPAQARVLNALLGAQQQRRFAILLTTDDPAVAFHIADEVAVMYLGRVIERGPTTSVLLSPLHPYTRLLLELMPDVTRPPPDPALAGEQPDPDDPPAGCAYHPRCPFAFLRCRFERPAHIQLNDVTVACHGVEEGRLTVVSAAAS